ncbi:uncharacterized protein LOC143444348 isoform X2 [Clavelina lepadiformis]|uniref:uncharacterized protein LOC143444348 isoform X2 n=1 Tax=Clavelina lepadiformis TaxID=159417 RepID=UPI0040433423
MLPSKLLQILVLFAIMLGLDASRKRADLLNSKEVSRRRANTSANVAGINLFAEMAPMNRVTFNKHWKWKSKSKHALVQEHVREEILQSVSSTISLEFRVKLNKRAKVSLFRAISFTDERNFITWLDIILNYPTSSIDLIVMNNKEVPTEYIFDWPNSMYKTWVLFEVTLSENRDLSTVSMRSAGTDFVQTLVVTDGIYLPFPQDTVFHIGGKGATSPKRFSGMISKAMVYIPIPAAGDTKSLSEPKKRGAPRKPLPAVETTSPSRHMLRTREPEDETLLMTLRSEIRQCQEENRRVNNMLTMLKDSQNHIQERLGYLETCECKPVCVADNGQQYGQDESWQLNECTTCTCNSGSIACQINNTCEGLRNSCSSSPCQNEGECRIENNGFVCQCQIGYRGNQCELIDQCARSVCQNGARCQLLSDNNYQCTCVLGFLGRHCELVDWCMSSPCRNRGVCTNGDETYECSCQNGFSGSQCQIREWCYESPCLNGGECNSQVEGFTCTCQNGYVGNRCERRDWCHSSPCLNHGECVSESEGYRCRCRRGFVGNHCQYSDLCETSPCQNTGKCRSLVTSEDHGGYDYECECPSGYSGKNCQLYDYCASSPCNNQGRCLNELEGYRCDCRSGFVGERCEVSDKCSTEPCMNGATCVNIGDRFKCQCADGYSGSLCERKDFCSGIFCMNGGTCVSESDGFACRCRQNYYGDRCEQTDYCRAIPCRNGGECRNTPHNPQQPFSCDCLAGFTGLTCQTRDICSSSPCLHGGKCSVRGPEYFCDCPESYLGSRCEYLDYCQRSPCLNGGECTNQDRGFVCSCPETHMGRRCENPHPCRSNPCLNGGECLSNDDGSYTCTCPSTHYGSQCDMFNACHSNPCQNGASCVNAEDGFLCMCLEGFYGIDCSFMDGCANNNPCQNGGECQNNDGAITCNCPSTLEGAHCEFEQNFCMFLPDRGMQCERHASQRRPRFEQRWYYDKFTQSCKSLQYSGCGGNSNNFATRQNCRQKCIIGACCLVPLLASRRKTTICRMKSLGQCKRINSERSDVQVIRFKPGEKCATTTCLSSEICMFGGVSYNTGDSVDLGCGKTCLCLDGGVFDCPCIETSVRREIRRLTAEDLKSYQNAIRTLKMTPYESGGNAWDAMRDEYMHRAPIAQSGAHFLLWNRVFLRQIELLLQKVNCKVAIPYYDFTMDAGKFNESIVWQPNYFGSVSDGNCIPDHPFKNTEEGDWNPCLIRNFDRNVAIPNIVDVAMTMSSKNLEELSSSLMQVASHVKAYIGGDMATPACAYDPLFLSIHAFIDNIFSQWQEMHPDIGMPSGLEIIPFGMPAELVWSGACASYVSMGYMEPCNRSDVSSNVFGEDGYNLQGFNREGFNRQGYDKDGFNSMGQDRSGRPDSRSLFIYDGYNAEGYNRAGFDRRGFNRYGFCNSFDRDGYDAFGFDRSGYNRYGFDKNGFDRNKFDIYGVSNRGMQDNSDFYDSDTGYSDCCFSRDGLTVSGLDRFGFSPAGYDMYQCSYFFHGPHSLYYQDKLWTALSIQPRSFLITLSRPCGSLSGQPRTFLELNWLKHSNQIPILQASDSINSTLSQKFCLDVDMIMSWCPCLEGSYPATCHINPCYNANCPLHPNARCHINMCGTCTAEFFLNGRRVNCEDPCQSNPCANRGTCTASRFSSASERFMCTCPSGFSGSLCERQMGDLCMLPSLPGSCTGRVRRWYYNKVTQSCEQFTYSGCGGNLNNFRNRQICNLRCAVGACCYRFLGNTSQIIGYDKDGYDKYGFNKSGINRNGQPMTSRNSLPLGNQVLGPKGFGYDGYNIYGFNELGCDRQGYNRDGYHNVTGYNRTGFNREGGHDQLTEYNQDGFNRQGLDRAGFRCNGLNLQGYNPFGYYREYTYECQSLSHSECRAMSETHEVLSFSPGKSCQEVHCGDKCGCDFNGEVRRFGEKFQHGCQECTCTLGGTVDCICLRLGKRKEIRDLTKSERTLYQSTIQKLYESGQWDYFVNIHSEHMPHANGRLTALPWHRYFLANVERELQKLSSCTVYIPYFDWTIDSGSLNESYVWSVAYFGGNGESETNCVAHHPFNGLDRWHPCIRRQFNSSISLPDAINFHLLLREPDFETFSLQLEAMSALFHLWVGGHMASPFSPYDPIFLSHWAFMDYMWSEWQKRNPMGLSRFPTAQRYVQLKPFDVTPDDVLSSQKQMCVNYISPTLGSPCNSSIVQHTLSINSNGFDRNGYDRNGFDIEGFDGNGRDRFGRRDARNMFDNTGYSKAGYHRSGFDSQGWDSYGFNRMNFNRDGIDIEGYDKAGYDQFGFDRDGKTPFGLFRNGSFAVGADQGYAASLFDRFGFNRFGLNSFGQDYNGNSAYGFNLRGYDQDNCNYYSRGPHYMRFFFFAHMQLKMLQKDSLEHIKRICSPITPLPMWVSQGWLANAERVKSLEQAWARIHPTDTTWMGRESSVTEDGLWAPVTPDKQFCFDLHWYSGCPLGTPLVDCPVDFCTMSKCASNPDAQCRTKNCGSCYAEFYDGASGEIHTCYGCIDNSGRVHSETSTWQENCTSCICQGGMISCTPVMCLSTSSCTHPAKLPGQCCESCEACSYEGKVYRNGEQMQGNRCETCQCHMGSVVCHAVTTSCPRLACTNPVRRPGECCPSCPIGCEGHSEGDAWSMGPCRTCRCIGKEMRCEENLCPAVECNHPYKPETSCCPQCRDCKFQGRIFLNGESFRRDVCTQCTCSHGNVNCVVQQCSPLQCVNQVTPPDSCCPVCVPGCEYDGQTYRNGDTFRPPRTPCQECVCQNNQVECHGRACQALSTCPRPVMTGGSCCPTCTNCHYGDRVYRNRQVWTSENGCERCRCENGNINCVSINPCMRQCSHGVTVRGQCCKECLRCSFNSRMYKDGEVFSAQNNPCQRCTCNRGNVTCEILSCPTLQCSSQRTLVGECCPSCEACRYGSESHEHGSSWRLNTDACTICTCQEGRIVCSVEDCDEMNCKNPITLPNTCCPSCSGCAYQGVTYNDGDMVESLDTCQSCTCQNGNVVCSQRECEELQCLSQVTISGECCPSCSSCTYQREIYSEGSTFISSRNPCLECLCESGETTCRRIDQECPELECSHPGREYGSCCPACDNCEYERRNYRNGATFTPPGASPCFVCSCVNGIVTCETDECEGIACQNPVQSPERCCPVCEVCEFGNVTYSSGDSWSADLCTSCTCETGRIECQLNECEMTTCSHPAMLSGTCCPKCEMCMMDNRVFSNGQSFDHPTAHCQVCQCEFGNIHCETSRCPPLTCSNSVMKRDSCCPICPTSCIVDETVSIEDGAKIAQPDDPCQLCTCRRGTLQCERACESPSCSHPISGECCRNNCDGCYYNGKEYYNGEVFTHHRDNCRKCTCRNGNVRCKYQQCPALECANPDNVEGACCPVCPAALTAGCEHDGRVVGEGEQFRDDCKICQCRDGLVSCKQKRCPLATCSHPTIRDCCRYCGGCKMSGIDYQNGDVVPNGSENECEICRCMSGDIVCARRSCPDLSCSHPAPDGCCSSCKGCLYGETMYNNGERFESADNSCNECTCRKGNVVCERKGCGDPECTHPVLSHNSCCPLCGGDCSLGDDLYTDGSTFIDSDNQCRSCTCEKGSIVCQAKSCTKVNCRNPTAGACNCPVCEGCSYLGEFYNNHAKFTNPEDERCSECYCQDGNVNCGRNHCQSSSCTHPTLDTCGCPECENCKYDGDTYENGEEFSDVEDTCNSCMCEDGNVVCHSRVCGEVDCVNPSIDRCGCPVCFNCNYLGVEYENNENLVDTMNKCNQCVCRLGTVQCAPLACMPVRCSNPVTSYGECCPKCIGTCFVEGEVFENGANFVLPSDSCSTCTCNSGEVRCVKQRCERSCSHPRTLTQCCPDCTACSYQGRVYEEGQLFTSHNNPCRKCSCYRGNVLCQDQRCPRPECASPRVPVGKCCPECPEELSNGCFEQGRLYEAGSRWLRRTPTFCSECSCDDTGDVTCIAVRCSAECSNPVPILNRCCPVCESCFYANRTYDNGAVFQPNNCQQCVCTGGNVRCVAKACAPLSCTARQQVRVGNNCCPQCVSCSAENQQHADGDTWTLPNDVCTSCQCQNGVITCSKTRCLPACQLMDHVPGECCPVCRGCSFGSKAYSIGDTFEPNPMDPCEVCKCTAAANGSPSLSCHHVLCPSMADCPRSCIRQPEPGTCCPTCTNRPECSYGNCLPAIHGQQIHPFDDPCYSCVCNSNDTWVCAHMNCPKLDCPQPRHYTPKGSCCPICDACHLPMENRDVANGYVWKIDECRTCRCDHGSIICLGHDCQMVTCDPPMIKYKQPGKCCEECVNPRAGCVYEGHSIGPQQRWLVDKCTTCHCFAGKVNCVTQRCRMPMCNSDEVATVIPGECCSRCVEQPGNCMAFGDPHYRTFDGRMVHFQGTCRYLMTSDCMKGHFRIEVENSNRGGSYGAVTWTDKVFITIASHKVVLNSEYNVSINGTDIRQLPILIPPHLFIGKSGNQILLNSHIGVQVLWNAAQRHLEVFVPGTYKRRTCGLCGNFNNYPQDDLRLRNARMTSSEVVFGNNWKIAGRNIPACPDVEDVDPCESLTYAQRKRVNNACKVIRSELFSACHQVVNPEMYFSACLHDVCACGDNNRFCLCDALEAYAAQCRRSGVVVRWRSPTLCAVHCPTERGYVFDECGSPCKRTCANKNLPPGAVEEQCFLPCVSGCQCVAGNVEHEGSCISPLHCPDNIAAIEAAPMDNMSNTPTF